MKLAAEVDWGQFEKTFGLVGEVGAEELLRETIQAGLRLKLIKPTQMQGVNVDTTVQEKNIRFPTDARLLDGAQAQAEGIELRQSYARVGKRELKQQSRYAHVKQFMHAGKLSSKNRLKGALGDKMNVILSAAGMNLHKILKDLAGTPGSLALFLSWLLELLRRALARARIAGLC